MIHRRRLTSPQRDELYRAECEKARAADRGDFAICNICSFPILPGREWDESHDPSKPHWLGGAVTGIAHRKCNRQHNHQFDTPLFAKNERVRKRHLDITRSRSPLPGGRDDPFKKTMAGAVVDRQTGAPWSWGR